MNELNIIMNMNNIGCRAITPVTYYSKIGVNAYIV